MTLNGHFSRPAETDPYGRLSWTTHSVAAAERVMVLTKHCCVDMFGGNCWGEWCNTTATTALDGLRAPSGFPRRDGTQVTISWEDIAVGAQCGSSAHKLVGERRHGDSVSILCLWMAVMKCQIWVIRYLITKKVIIRLLGSDQLSLMQKPRCS